MKPWTLAAIGTLYATLAVAQTRPGHTGTLPDPRPHHSLDGETVGPPPTQFFCDHPEQASVTARARVRSCKTADYAKLYDAALADSARLDAYIVCPEECGPAKRFMVQQEWNCFEDEAEVELTWVLLCPKETRPPREMDRPSAEAFKEPMRYGREGRWQPKPKGALAVRIESSTSDALDCPSNRFVGFTYEEDTDSCEDVNYVAAIKRGDIEARRWFDSLKCPSPCEKTAFTVVYKEWTCILRIRNWIKVEYLLSVGCRK